MPQVPYSLVISGPRDLCKGSLRAERQTTCAFMMPEGMRVSAAIPVGRPRAREPIFLEHGVNESFQEQVGSSI